VKKKKLTKGQTRRIRDNHAKKLKKITEHWQDSDLGEAESGIVISRFGQHADVEDAHHQIIRCNIRRTIESLVCGDRVIWRRSAIQQQGISGVIEAVEPRQSELARPDVYDGLKPIAANIDQIFVVSSPLPAFNTDIIDRYLVAAHQTGIDVIILLNKIDLLSAEQLSNIEQQLAIYRHIGYPVMLASSVSDKGIDALEQQLKDKTSIFVGQSGVGKSTLVNRLIPELSVETNEVSDNSGLGQHTTTVARLYHFPQGGQLIDSPGIREFGLWHLTPEQVFDGFIEFEPYRGLCKFRDCKHLTDPGCALREAVEHNEITQQRFDSYHRIIESLSSNKLTSRFND
jgi:ribosome biogenesis GTPase